MSVVYILAHLDDEYCAAPLIWQARREGLDQHLLYLADYRDRRMGRRRLAETRAYVARQGLPPERAQAIGLDGGIFDGALHLRVPDLLALVLEAVSGVGQISRIVTPAWEGGHMDHDVCAWLGVRLGERLGAPVRQFSLYHGEGLPGPLLRGASPLAENGPVRRIELSPGEWLRWAAGVRAFPSQAYAWSGIWPAMMLGLARHGFGWQGLSSQRVEQRPHAGRLFYERMFKVPYEEVRAALDAAHPAGARPITKRPARIRPTPAQ